MPRPVTVAFANQAKPRPATYGSWNDMPVEQELRLTRAVAKRLFNLLAVRDPRVLDQVIDELKFDARATVDREFEASLLLFERHRIDVVPCRKILFMQDDAEPRFVLTRPGGESEIVDSAKLLMLAGLVE